MFYPPMLCSIFMCGYRSTKLTCRYADRICPAQALRALVPRQSPCPCHRYRSRLVSRPQRCLASECCPDEHDWRLVGMGTLDTRFRHCYQSDHLHHVLGLRETCTGAVSTATGQGGKGGRRQAEAKDRYSYFTQAPSFLLALLWHP